MLYHPKIFECFSDCFLFFRWTQRPVSYTHLVRALAAELGVNAMTVSKAYQMLKQEGFIVSDRRSGARVRERGPQDGTLTWESREQLRVLAAEAKARGMSRADFLGMCGAFFGEE